MSHNKLQDATHHQHHRCPACDFAPFTRNNYFTGKLLVERDFTDEARYHIDKLRHHEQRLHGWGVVCGLKIRQHEQEPCRERFFCVEPGTAVDCCGRDIIVREAECVDLTHLPALAELRAKNDDAAHTLQICIRYRECPTEEIPVLFDECGCDDTQCAPNRILESYALDVKVDPKEQTPGEALAEDCREILWRHLDGCPHCDEPDCVVLATIENYRVGDKLTDQTDPPADLAADQAAHIARINNRKGRRLLPSTQVLTELIECLLEKGGGGAGAQGPPGAQGVKGNKGEQGEKGDKGEKGDAADGLEKGLTRIKALSWVHNTEGNSLLEVLGENGRPVGNGVVIGFTDKVQVNATAPGGTVNLIDAKHIFQVLVNDERRDQEFRTICRCAVRGTIVPVKFSEDTPGHINKATQLPPGNAPGVAFLFEDRLIELIKRGAIPELWVALRGDFVKDTKQRAIDAEFVRAELPTGDRAAPPSALPLKDQPGIQGGLFESWFGVRRG